MRDDSAEILFQSFLREAIVSKSGTDRDIHFLTSSIKHSLCRPWPCPPSNVSWRMGLERPQWRLACSNHASFRLLTVASRGSCGPTRRLILLRSKKQIPEISLDKISSDKRSWDKHGKKSCHTERSNASAMNSLSRSLTQPQWGSADAEIKVPSGENTELKRSPFKPGVGQYIAIHATLTARDFFLAYSTLPGPFTCILSKTSPDFSLC